MYKRRGEKLPPVSLYGGVTSSPRDQTWGRLKPQVSDLPMKGAMRGVLPRYSWASSLGCPNGWLAHSVIGTEEPCSIPCRGITTWFPGMVAVGNRKQATVRAGLLNQNSV